MTSPSKLSLLSLVSLLSAASVASTASPADARPRWRERAGFVDVTHLDGVRDGRHVAIDLEIDAGSWRWMQDRGVEPLLHVQLGSRGLERAYRLADPTSHIVLDGDRDSDAATVWITGDGRRTQISSMRIAGIRVYSLELSLRDAADDDRPAPPPEPRWAQQPDVIRACALSNDQARCLSAAARARFNPVPVLQACGRSMSTYDLVAQCVDIAVTAASDPSDRLSTCVRLSSTFDGTMRCFKASVRAVYDPKPAIQQCVIGSSTLDLMYGCIDLVTAVPQDPTELVKACQTSARTTDQILPCIQRATAPTR